MQMQTQTQTPVLMLLLMQYTRVFLSSKHKCSARPSSNPTEALSRNSNAVADANASSDTGSEN
jgi:hypothetical protein